MAPSNAGRALALAAVLACGTAPLAAQTRGGDPALVGELHAAGRYGAALAEVERLEDQTLAAEWRCYLCLAGGDFPGALAAAEAGLQGAPTHQGLLVNAISMALSLGLSERALTHAQALLTLLETSDPSNGDELERARRLHADALTAVDSTLLARAGRARARWLVLAALAGTAASMFALARRTSQQPA